MPVWYRAFLRSNVSKHLISFAVMASLRTLDDENSQGCFISRNKHEDNPKKNAIHLL